MQKALQIAAPFAFVLLKCRFSRGAAVLGAVPQCAGSRRGRDQQQPRCRNRIGSNRVTTDESYVKNAPVVGVLKICPPLASPNWQRPIRRSTLAETHLKSFLVPQADTNHGSNQCHLLVSLFAY
jgi:hypothetical protein